MRQAMPHLAHSDASFSVRCPLFKSRVTMTDLSWRNGTVTDPSATSCPLFIANNQPNITPHSLLRHTIGPSRQHVISTGSLLPRLHLSKPVLPDHKVKKPSFISELLV